MVNNYCVDQSSTNTTKHECCCSDKKPAGWGPLCERCPNQGTRELHVTNTLLHVTAASASFPPQVESMLSDGQRLPCNIYPLCVSSILASSDSNAISVSCQQSRIAITQPFCLKSYNVQKRLRSIFLCTKTEYVFSFSAGYTTLCPNVSIPTDKPPGML